MERISKFADFTYSENSEKYISDMVKYLDENAYSILKFFGVSSDETNITVNIFDDLDEFRKHVKETRKKYGKEKDTEEWICGFTAGNHIDIINYDLYKDMKNESFEDYKKMLVHEFVHAVHFTSKDENYKKDAGSKWINEGLAIYFSKQMDSNITFDKNVTKEILRNGDTNYKNYFLAFLKVLNSTDINFIRDISTKYDFYLENEDNALNLVFNKKVMK